MQINQMAKRPSLHVKTPSAAQEKSPERGSCGASLGSAFKVMVRYHLTKD
jgi:hypothetical protein